MVTPRSQSTHYFGILNPGVIILFFFEQRMSIRMSQRITFRSNLKDACPLREPYAIPLSQFNIPTMRYLLDRASLI